MLLHSRNKEFIIARIPLVDFIPGHKAVFGFVNASLVTELGRLGELAFFDGASLRIKETDHAIGNPSVSGHDLLGLLDEFLSQRDGVTQLFFQSLDGGPAFILCLGQDVCRLYTHVFGNRCHLCGDRIQIVPRLCRPPAE